MTFPSIDSAAEYVRSRLRDFYAQNAILKNQLIAVSKLVGQARRNNDQEALGRLIIAQEQAKQLYNEQQALEDKLAPFADYFGVKPQLGVLPFVLAGVAVAAASMLYLHFEKIQNQTRALDLIAKGMLKPADAQAILNPSLFSVGGFGALLPLLFGGGVLYFFLTGRKA